MSIHITHVQVRFQSEDSMIQFGCTGSIPVNEYVNVNTLSCTAASIARLQSLVETEMAFVVSFCA